MKGIRLNGEETSVVAIGMAYAIDHAETLAALQFSWLHGKRVGDWHKQSMRESLDDMKQAYDIRQRIYPLSYPRSKSCPLAN